MPPSPPARLPLIAEMNALPASEFARALAPLFEGAPRFLARLATRRPFTSDADLFAHARELVRELPPGEKREMLDAHPALGADPEEVRRRSEIAYREQGYDRAPAEQPDETLRSGEGRAPAGGHGAGSESGEAAATATHARVAAELTELNAGYRAKFGFTFVTFVNRRPLAEIIPVLRARIQRTEAEEMHTALGEIVAIAEDRARRLREVAAGGDSPAAG